ncbi:hypothetical protein BaRGS_00005747 [Batillaria attramentaria]|uniref:C-type lectin domain-containing protein n=1 Tax=Batillaria attramentaria TaxID=370345 RepID=A0ABD0LVC7_9CAEN
MLGVCWLGLLLQIVSGVEGVSDFDAQRAGYEFIYHDTHNLVLIIHGNKCYFTEFTDVMDTQLLVDGMKNHTEDALIAIIENGIGSLPDGYELGLRPSTLSYVRDKYTDRLADYHCLDKHLFTLEKVGQCLDCKVGWTRFQDSCYVLLREHVPWTSAKIMCEALGGGLLEIHSKAENDFITQLARHNGREYLWLGLTDLAHEGKWVWISNGQAPDYNNFLGTAPNNLQNHEGGEDCAYLKVPESGHWGDYYCELHTEDARYHIAAACETK